MQYINYLPIYSHGAMINFIEAPRDIGKTFTAQLWGTKRFLKSGRKFIWGRRTEEETISAKKKFFKKTLLKLCQLTEEDVKIKGKYGYIRRGKKWVDFVEFVSLSRAATERSVDDPDYDLMFIDEAFATPSRVRQYVGNEVQDFIDLFISKMRDHKLTAFLLGNKEMINNPYYDYFGIKPPREGFTGIKKYRNGQVLVYTSDAPAVTINDKGLRAALTGTAYGAYMFEGAARATPIGKYAPRPKKARVYACIDFGQPFTLWKWQGKLYAQIGVDVSRLVFVSRETMGKYPRAYGYGPTEKSRFAYVAAIIQRGKMFYCSPLAAEVAEAAFLKIGIIK